MLNHTLDQGVYIRSMASRGDEGGLSRAAKNAIRILDAAGNDIVIVETVGIGQAEIEIVKVADLVIVVLMPESGDEIQAIKAGLMEIGDIFIVNKSDLPGADKVIYNIEPILSTKASGWKQRALQASAKSGRGLEESVTVILQYKDFIATSPLMKNEKKEKLKDEIIESITQSLSDSLKSQLLRDKHFLNLVEKAIRREIDPETAVQNLLKQYTLSKSNSGEPK